MKIQRLFVNKEALIKLLTGDDAKVNHPLGYAYCSEVDGLSCSAFIGTQKGTNDLYLTKSGDIVFNIKVDDAKMKGDHTANTPAVSAEAQQDSPPALTAAEQEEADQQEKLRAQL